MMKGILKRFKSNVGAGPKTDNASEGRYARAKDKIKRTVFHRPRRDTSLSDGAPDDDSLYDPDIGALGQGWYQGSAENIRDRESQTSRKAKQSHPRPDTRNRPRRYSAASKKHKEPTPLTKRNSESGRASLSSLVSERHSHSSHLSRKSYLILPTKRRALSVGNVTLNHEQAVFGGEHVPNPKRSYTSVHNSSHRRSTALDLRVAMANVWPLTRKRYSLGATTLGSYRSSLSLHFSHHLDIASITRWSASFDSLGSSSRASPYVPTPSGSVTSTYSDII